MTIFYQNYLTNIIVEQRPHTTVVLAISADGKIADTRRCRDRHSRRASPAKFCSQADGTHLEKQTTAVMPFHLLLEWAPTVQR